MSDIILGRGDGVAAVGVDLTDRTLAYVKPGVFSAPDPAARDLTREVKMPLWIVGATPDQVEDAKTPIVAALADAPGAKPPYPTGSPVVLSVRLGTTQWVYFDVLSGALDVEQIVPGNTLQSATLTLTCLAATRGDPFSVSLGTIASGSYSAPFAVPGDVDAYARATVADVSTSTKVLQSVALGVLSVPGLVATDFVPVLDMAPAGNGASTTDTSDYLGADFARTTPTSDWSTVASVSRPAAAIRNVGRFDVYGRVRDSHANVVAPDHIVSLTARKYAANLRQAVPLTSFTGSATSYAVTWGTPTLAGSTLAIAVGWANNVSITTPSGWTAQTRAGTGPNAQIFTINESAARSGAETLVFSGAPGPLVINMLEVVGGRYTTAVNRSVQNTAAAASVSVSLGALTDPNELILSVSKSNLTTVNGGTVTYTAGSVVNDGEVLEYLGADVNLGHATATTAPTVQHAWPSATSMAIAAISIRLQSAVAPAMPADAYTFVIAGVDSLGNVSLASQPASITTTAVGSLTPTWTPSAVTPDHYRLYWRRGSAVTYRYLDMPAGKSYAAYTINTESGATVGTPPSTAVENGSWRAGVSAPGGATRYYGKRVRSALAAGRWEVVYLGQLSLPPIPLGDDGSFADWSLAIECRHPDGGGMMDVDAVWLFPAIDQSSISASALAALATKREWVMETTRHGRTLGWLRPVGGGVAVDTLNPLGDWIIAPGNAVVVPRYTVQSGVSDVVDAKATVTLTITPRYRFLRGST